MHVSFVVSEGFGDSGTDLKKGYNEYVSRIWSWKYVVASECCYW